MSSPASRCSTSRLSAGTGSLRSSGDLTGPATLHEGKAGPGRTRGQAQSQPRGKLRAAVSCLIVAFASAAPTRRHGGAMQRVVTNGWNSRREDT